MREGMRILINLEALVVSLPFIVEELYALVPCFTKMILVMSAGGMGAASRYNLSMRIGEALC